MTRLYVSGLLIFGSTIFAAGPARALETLPGEPEIGDTAEVHVQAVPPDAPLATGRVVAVDHAAGKVTLSVRPLPQRFPEGGTRVFRVGDPESLKDLSPGDKVRFEVERDGRRYTVTRIENSN